MLALSLKPNQAVEVGSRVAVTLLEKAGDHARVSAIADLRSGEKLQIADVGIEVQLRSNQRRGSDWRFVFHTMHSVNKLQPGLQPERFRRGLAVCLLRGLVAA